MTSQDGKGWDKGLVGGAKEWLPYWNVVSFFSQFLIGALAALIIAKLHSSSKAKKLYFDGGAILLISCGYCPGRSTPYSWSAGFL